MCPGQGSITLHSTARFIAAGLGSGWLPMAPGSWGSLAALMPGWWILRETGTGGLLAAVAILLVIACWACVEALRGSADTDPGWIVVDEWLGQWLCVALLSMTVEVSPGWLAGAFVMFRCLDVLKPWPISAVEHWGPPWWSIQADDLVAGLMAGTLLMGISVWL